MSQTTQASSNTTGPSHPIDQFRLVITSPAMEQQFKNALPPHVDVKKFIRILITSVQGNPKLLECDRQTLYQAAMQAAADGLLPDGREAAIIPRSYKAKYSPMIAGILKKIRNSGELSAITANVVYEKDEFKFWIDDGGEHVVHNPLIFGERGGMKGAYCLAKLKDGQVMIEVMGADEIQAVRKMSTSKTDSPWDGPFASEMWRKTPLRRLSKRLPQSTDLEHMLKEDDELFMPAAADASPASESKTRSDKLSSVVKAAAPAAAPSPQESQAESPLPSQGAEPSTPSDEDVPL